MARLPYQLAHGKTGVDQDQRVDAHRPHLHALVLRGSLRRLGRQHALLTRKPATEVITPVNYSLFVGSHVGEVFRWVLGNKSG